MGKILSNNQINQNNVSSITHTESGGTITELTDIENIIDRSVVNDYQFTFTSIFNTKTLTINLSNSVDIDGVAVMGMKTDGDINSIGLFSGGTLLSNCTEITRQTRTVEGKVVDDFIWSANSDVGGLCNRIVITWVNENTGTGYIGNVFAGKSLYDFCVKPTVNYNPEVSGTKERTEGGQVIGTHNGSYRVVTFQSIALPSTFFTSKLNNLNSDSGVSLPLVFVPLETDQLLLYGTQKKPFSLKTVIAKGEDDNQEIKWLQEASFTIEEEF